MGKFKVTLVRSKYGVNKRQLGTLQALGLTKRMKTVEVDDTPVYKGMINKVRHLVQVEEI